MSVTITKISNPFEPDINVIEVVDHAPGAPLSHYLSDIPFGEKDIEFVVCINGTSPIDGMATIVENDDRISVCAKLGVMASSAIAAMVTSMATSAAVMGIGGSFAGLLGAGMTAAAGIYGATFLASMFMIGYGTSRLVAALSPDAPKSISAENVYGWGQLSQTNQEGMSIPYLYGTCKVSGNVLNQFTTVNEDGDETLNALMGICDHEIDSIADVRINDQVYTFFDQVDVYTRLGTNNDAIIPGFNELIDQTDVGSKISYGSVTTKQTNGDCEKLNIRISAPGGIYYMDSEGTPSVLYAACSLKYKTSASSTYITHSVLVGGKTSLVKEGVDTTNFTGDVVDAGNEFGVKYIFDESMSESARQIFITDNLTFFSSSSRSNNGSVDPKVYEITIDDLALDQYDFQVERINPDWEGSKETSYIYLQSWQEIIKQNLIYPGLAKYAVTAMATDQLSNSVPAFSCLATKNTVPVYNPTTEVWDSKPANNLAWVVYDLIVNKAGISKDRIIYDEFGDFADHVSSLGIETGIYITGVNGSNFKAEIQRIASIGRGAIIPRGTKYGVFIDKADSTVSHMFNSGNIIEDSLTISWLEKADIANAVEIEYTDPDRDNTRQVTTIISSEYLTSTDSSNSKSTAQIEAAISQQVAIDYGVFLINCNKHLTKSVQFDAFVNSFACTVGDIFYYQQEIPNSDDCYTGRIVGAGNDDGDGNPYVTLDKSVTLGSGSAYLIIQMLDGSFVEKQVLGISTKENSFTLTAIWSTIPNAYDVYSIGTQISIKKKYRLVSATRQDDFVRTLTGLEYIDEIYTDRSGTIIEEPTWDRVTQEALNVQLHETLAYNSDGSYRSIINASWSSSLGNFDQSGWDIWSVNMNNGTAILVGLDVKRQNYTIDRPLAIGAEYKILVVPSSQGMNDTGSNTATITIQGKLAPPSDVLGFSGAWDAMKRQVYFSWTAIDDIDLSLYEIRQGVSWADGTKIAESSGTSKSIFIDEGVSESITYWIAAKDDSGIYSETPASTVVVINTSDCGLAIPTGLTLSTSSAIASDGTDTVSLSAIWNSNAESSDDFRNYEIWLEEISIGKFSEFATEKTQYRWDIKPNTEYGVAVRAVDQSGNVTDFCTQETITTAKDSVPPDAPTWPASLDIIPGFKLIGLNWNDVSATDLANYVFERSETGAFTGEQFESGGIDASYTTDTQLAVDTLYYYRVKAVDTSGNESGWSATKSTTTLQVGTSDIAYNAIIANHILVNNLAAISANIGLIIAGRLESANGESYIDLDNNIMAFGDKFLYNGTELSIDAEVTFKSGSSGYENISDAPVQGNLVRTPSFESGEIGDWNGGTIVSATGQDFSKAIQSIGRDILSTAPFEVFSGQKLFARCMLNSSGTPYTVRFGVLVKDKDNANVAFLPLCGQAAGYSWALVEGTNIVPAGGVLAYPWLQVDGSSAFGTAEFAMLQIAFSAFGADITATSDFVAVTYPTDKAELEEAIDGKIITWFQDADPSIDWSGTDASHAGDMWWTLTTNELRRYTGSGWPEDPITDPKAIEAYSDAADAQDTADSKRRVFTAIPTVPYDVGDLWDTGNGFKRSNTNKTDGQSYSSVDWGVVLPSGSGINVMSPRYCIFADPELPPYTNSNGIVTQSTTSKFGGFSLKIAPTGSDAWVNFKASTEDANMIIEPNQKWLVSFWARSSAVGIGKKCQFFLATYDGSSHTYYSFSHTFAEVDVWEQAVGILDLTSDDNTEAYARVDNDGDVGCHMYFDGFMMEKQAGTGVIPSTFSLPSAKSGNDLTGWGHPDNTTEINGGVIHTDSIFADSIWLDDSLEINSGGDIFSGKATAASTTTGFFLGVEENVPKFNVGDGTKYMRWLGSTLEVGGEIVATENIEDNAVTSTSSYYIDGEITLSTTYQTIISAPSAIMGVTSGDQVFIWFNAIQSAGERNSPDITYRLYVGGELEYTSWPMKDYKSFVVVITAPSTGNLALSVQAISAATDTTYTQYAALRNRAVLALVTRK